MSDMSAWPAVGALLLALGTAALLPRIGSPHSTAVPRYSSLDGLRGYLDFAVFLSHSSVWYGYLRSGMWSVPPSNFYTHLGQSSVAMFFMMTGFLFWSKLLDGRVQPIEWSRLYLSRVFRLVPLYLVTVMCLLLVSLYSAGFRLNEPISSLALHISKWLAFTIPGTAPINGFTETMPLAGVTWSLPYEWLFYVFLPLGSFCLRAGPPVPWLLFSVTAVVAFVMIMPDVQRPMLVAFGGGIAAAWIVRVAAIRSRLAHWAWGTVAVACFATTMWSCPTAYTVSAMVLLAGGFTIIACGNSLFGVLEWSPSVVLGEMGYSLYLLHSVVLFVAYRLLLGERASMLSSAEHWSVVFCLVPVLIVLCHVTFRLIEKPAMAAAPRCHAWLAARLT
ncbi:MAG: Acyltransferase 3 [Nitrospira sp.]|jgi:peptidoglycan/LPS O-acetylase OafA/YrhL|nr:MAG: Acyltransferase 3 [Nitrospira sp.]